MDRNELIGNVIALYLRNRLTQEEASGTARYLLDCLEAEQTAAVGMAILSDQSLYNLIEVRLPAHFVGHLNLPDEVLTNERATYFRNASCNKSAILTANTGDDEEQSLKELIPINATTLQTYPELWVSLSAEGITISEEHKDWWVIALKAILEIRALPLEGYAEYILKTREAIVDGNPILSALGMALPALRAPEILTTSIVSIKRIFGIFLNGRHYMLPFSRNVLAIFSNIRQIKQFYLPRSL